MNPITNALADLHYAIPREVLEKAFLSLVNHRTHIPISVDSRIRELVIEPRVLKDCNLLGGTEMLIDLSGCPVQYIETYSAVYTIPKNLTQGRTITRALSIAYGPGIALGSNYAGSNAPSAFTMAAGQVMQSNAPIPMVATAQCSMVGENTVMISDVNIIPSNVWLRCWIENDSELSTLQATAYPVFSKLVEHAVKAYIFNHTRIQMDIGFIHAGSELGMIKEVIESYSDAAANYETLRDTRWRKVAALNDFAFRKRHITMVTGLVGL